MARPSSKTWRRLWLLATVLAVAAFVFLLPRRLTAPARVLFNEAVAPAQTAAFQAAGDALAAGGTLTEMFLRRDRESALERELVKLRNENSALSDSLLRQRQSLDSMGKLQVLDLAFRALRTPVSSYDTSAMHRSVTVRAGTSSGAGSGLAVASEGALAGIVTEAGPFESRVRLITDPGSSVACRVTRTREICILQGTGGEECSVDWLNRDSFVEPGDTLVTASVAVAGQSGLRVPDGLPAATVLRVERDPMRPLFMRADAAPMVDLNRLEAVEVLVPE